MTRTITTLIVGTFLGALLLVLFYRFGSAENPAAIGVVRDIVDVPAMAPAVAESHRDEHYSKLTSVQQIMALPTEFARAEATYALAGRSAPADVQSLIFDADRVADDLGRIELLNIFFFRLAETDPDSALALARIKRFRGNRSIEDSVWRAWARKDLGEALFAAKTQASAISQDAAAQSLFAAFGYMGNETTERIEAELGVAPNRETRSLYLYQLADESPAEAITFINGVENVSEQQEYATWLARYISLREPTDYSGYANLFALESVGARFKAVVENNLAQDNPQAIIERLLASGQNLTSNSQYRYALQSLASKDIDAALAYFEQADTNVERQALGYSIATALAAKDPVQALAWARDNDRGGRLHLETMVLSRLAQTDPDLAFREAVKGSGNRRDRDLVSTVIQQIAQYDPIKAAGYIEQIETRSQRAEASQQLAYMWIGQDPEAAIEWIQSQDNLDEGQILQMAGMQLVNYDIDAAIRLLPELTDRDSANLRQQIVQQIATEQSPIEAQNFIAQFEGQPEYDQLQASLIAGVAESDPIVAKQLADQISDSDVRDAAYVQVVANHARTDPAEAARWLNNVKEETMRATAAGQLAANWYQNDPAAATLWVTNLTRGPSRDDAIMQLSYRWGESNAEKMSLIASIEDRDKRGQAKIRQAYEMMQTDPEEARQMLADEDIPKYLREQAESNFVRYRYQF